MHDHELKYIQHMTHSIIQHCPCYYCMKQVLAYLVFLASSWVVRDVFQNKQDTTPSVSSVRGGNNCSHEWRLYCNLAGAGAAMGFFASATLAVLAYLSLSRLSKHFTSMLGKHFTS